MSLVPVPQFTQPSYRERNANAVLQCINLFAEKTINGVQLINSAGLRLLGTVTNNFGCMGAIYVIYGGTGYIYAFNLDVIYRINLDGTFTAVTGTYGPFTHRVSAAFNGTQIIAIDSGVTGYIITMSTNAAAEITDGNFPAGPITATYQNGYFIVNDLNTGRFYLSALNNGVSWTPQTYDSASADPDDLRALISNGTYLYLLGQSVSEVFYNTGNATFPFERVTGSIIPVGIGYYGTLATINGVIYFMGSGSGGQGSVWEINGTTPKKISTESVEEDIASWGGSPIGFCFEARGHQFYQITSVSNTSTWCYDITLDAWHKKTSAALGYHRAAIILNAFQYNSPTYTGVYALDLVDGKIYAVDPDYNRENGTTIVRTVAFGPVESGNTKRVFHNQIRFEIEIEYDASGTTSLAPTLDWTDNNGLTYSTPITITKTVVSSATGQRVLLAANRLGSSACRYYRLIFSGPSAKLILKKCEIELSEGRF